MILGLIDISVVRNMYGRQRDSFTAEVEPGDIGVVKAASIRAPGIIEAWDSARIISCIEHPVAGRMGTAAVQGNMIAVTFHPEIKGDIKLYNYFLSMARK